MQAQGDSSRRPLTLENTLRSAQTCAAVALPPSVRSNCCVGWRDILPRHAAGEARVLRCVAPVGAAAAHHDFHRSLLDRPELAEVRAPADVVEVAVRAHDLDP